MREPRPSFDERDSEVHEEMCKMIIQYRLCVCLAFLFLMSQMLDTHSEVVMDCDQMQFNYL